MPRLFLGTYLNEDDQTALGQLPKLNSTLETTWNCRIKWSKPNQLHLTWIFFGDIEKHQIDTLCRAIAQTINANRPQLPPTDGNISLMYERLEYWFNRQTPSLLALVPAKRNMVLMDYAQSVRIQLSEYTAINVRQQAKKPFKPHITLARLANITGREPTLPFGANHELSPNAIDGLANLLPLMHKLDTMSIIESVERDGSHQYNTIKNFSMFDPKHDGDHPGTSVT